MRVPNLAMFLGCLLMLSVHSPSAEEPKTEPEKPIFTARIEVDEHEHCFTVRFFLKNNGLREEHVIYGRGGAGLEVVPIFEIVGKSLRISPPTYLSPPRRRLEPNTVPIPAGKEILYGTFTMGYPQFELEREEKLTAMIYFQELKATFRTEAVPLKIPEHQMADGKSEK